MAFLFSKNNYLSANIFVGEQSTTTQGINMTITSRCIATLNVIYKILFPKSSFIILCDTANVHRNMFKHVVSYVDISTVSYNNVIFEKIEFILILIIKLKLLLDTVASYNVFACSLAPTSLNHYNTLLQTSKESPGVTIPFMMNQFDKFS